MVLVKVRLLDTCGHSELGGINFPVEVLAESYAFYFSVPESQFNIHKGGANFIFLKDSVEVIDGSS